MFIKLSKLRRLISEATRTYEVDPDGKGTIFVDALAKEVVQKMRAAGISIEEFDEDGNQHEGPPVKVDDWVLSWNYNDVGAGQSGVWKVGQVVNEPVGNAYGQRISVRFTADIDWESGPDDIHLENHVSTSGIWWHIPDDILESAFKSLEDRAVQAGQVDWRPNVHLPEDDY